MTVAIRRRMFELLPCPPACRCEAGIPCQGYVDAATWPEPSGHWTLDAPRSPTRRMRNCEMDDQ